VKWLPSRDYLLPPNNLAGRKRRACSSANRAPIVIPTSRNGSESNQTIGKRIRASRATGQHNTNRMHQSTSKISTFITNFVSFGLSAVHYNSSPSLERRPRFPERIDARGPVFRASEVGLRYSVFGFFERGLVELVLPAFTALALPLVPQGKRSFYRAAVLHVSKACEGPCFAAPQFRSLHRIANCHPYCGQ
jgi:hypothetical protein